MKFYKMYAQPCVEEYVVPGDGIDVLFDGCLYSEFQYLDHAPIAVEVAEDGGVIFPDFIVHRTIPLISIGMREVLDRFNADYLFYKPVQLTIAARGIAEDYWLALPPRIDCLDVERSIFVVGEEEDNRQPLERRCEVEKIVIAQKKIGRFDIFKIANSVNQEIIVTERLKNALERGSFENLCFYELEE